ncbi:MAG: isopeptide-forming domain-containing fimbrial protein [Symploca sp. SIO1B1]|nr:isopeptide-forming domain-containing fimbrial protein [Symploca sp. SIO1B1]
MKYFFRNNLPPKFIHNQGWLLSNLVLVQHGKNSLPVKKAFDKSFLPFCLQFPSLEGLGVGCAFCLLALLGWTQAVNAEGSRELTNNGGNRPFLDSRSDNDPVANIPRRTTIEVFVNTNETINLGSSANGVNQGRIRYTNPNGITNTCPTAGGIGRIDSRDEELAGPLPTGGGYNPCQVRVDVPGIWTIEFISPDGATGTQDPPQTLANILPAQNNNDSFVSAWDVTVRNVAGNDLDGRAYATYIPLNLGANGLSLNSRTFVQTQRGDLFRVNLNGIDPFGFIFFANNKGFTDAAGNPIFQSVFNDPVPNFHLPSNPDTAEDITFKLFFNPPNLDLPREAPVALFNLANNPPTIVGTTNTFLRQDPPLLPQLQNLAFEFRGVDGTPGRADPTKGGEFVFDTTEVGSVQITIDVNRNGILGDGNDVILTSATMVGTNIIPWDGRDSNGNPLPAGETPYQSAVSFFVGDVHFPFLDPENDPTGLIIERVNRRTLEVEDSLVYYNDTPVNNQPGGPDPISGLLGVDSRLGAHDFDQLFGDAKGIDTWTSLATPVFLVDGILIQKAELTIDKVASTNLLQAGSPVSFTLTVRSLPNDQANPALIPPDTFTPVEGIKVTDNVPDTIGNVTWTCEVTSGVGSCVTLSGTGNNVDVTLNLDPGAEVKITIDGVVSPLASGELVNTAIVNVPPDTLEPNPQQDPDDPLGNVATARLDIALSPIQPVGIKSSRLAIDADSSGNLTTGDTVEYTIIYSNQDPEQDVLDFLATDTIDTSKVTFVPGSYSLDTSGGATVTANPTFNGTTDINLTSPDVLGTLPKGGSQIILKYQVKIDAPQGAQISNQAVATSRGGRLDRVVTDSFSGPGDLPTLIDDGVNTGNLSATDDDDPTVITVGAANAVNRGEPTFVLVKRITNIIKNGFPIGGINFGISVDDPNDPNDNLPGWSQLSTGAPVGVFQFDQPLASGDLVEYTIYFLVEGTQFNNIQLCDPIPEGTTFVSNSFGVNQGILLNQNGAEVAQTNVADTDTGRFFSPLAPLLSPPCPNPIEPQGAIFVDLGDIPPTTPGNVGFVRFRVRID